MIVSVDVRIPALNSRVTKCTMQMTTIGKRNDQTINEIGLNQTPRLLTACISIEYLP